MSEENDNFTAIIKFRAEPELLDALKDIAKRKRQKLSVVIREYAWAIVDAYKAESESTIGAADAPGKPLAPEAKASRQSRSASRKSSAG